MQGYFPFCMENICETQSLDLPRLKSDCKNLGIQEITENVFVEVVADNLDDISNVYLKFTNNNQYLEIPKKEVSLGFFETQIIYINSGKIYLINTRHESFLEFYFYDGKNWNQQDFWLIVKDYFEDDQAVPFSIKASDKYILLTEENFYYPIFDERSANRVKYRHLFFINSESEEIVRHWKIPR